MTERAIEKLALTHTVLYEDKSKVLDSIHELTVLKQSIIASIEREFEAKISKIQALGSFDRFDVIDQCHKLLKTLSGNHVALVQIPDWLTKFTQNPEMLPEFSTSWSAEEYNSMKEYFTTLIANAEHITARSRARGRRTGYKGRDTTLDLYDDFWGELEFIDKSKIYTTSNCECFNEDVWLKMFGQACKTIPENTWDWGDGCDSEYVHAVVSMSIIIFQRKPHDSDYEDYEDYDPNEHCDI